ncbi:MAG TPA: LysR family transcriptional regulator [Anaerovoracaceae bacterium]|nr:LysR family transcriptional regulator [Anaerovoracaceae bacterium]
MDIRSLKYFISAAQNLNFTKAASECFITQTAMSLSIAKLEEELNFKLFYRCNHRVKLTDSGEVFF